MAQRIPAQHLQLLYQLQVMFGHLQESEHQSFDTRSFCSAYRDYDSLPINPSMQMDADEFLNILFDQLESALRRTASPKLLEGLFAGELANVIYERDTGVGRKLRELQISSKLERFFVISLTPKATLAESLAHFVEGEVLEGDNKYHHEATGEYVEVFKRQCLHALPAVLILHLKRFEFDFDLMKKVKLNALCEFPDTLDMAPYTLTRLEEEPQQPRSAEGAKRSLSDSPPLDPSDRLLADRLRRRDAALPGRLRLLTEARAQRPRLRRADRAGVRQAGRADRRRGAGGPHGVHCGAQDALRRAQGRARLRRPRAPGGVTTSL